MHLLTCALGVMPSAKLRGGTKNGSSWLVYIGTGENATYSIVCIRGPGKGTSLSFKNQKELCFSKLLGCSLVILQRLELIMFFLLFGSSWVLSPFPSSSTKVTECLLCMDNSQFHLIFLLGKVLFTLNPYFIYLVVIINSIRHISYM